RPGGALNGVISSRQLMAYTVVRHFCEVRMRPTVVSDFVSFARRARDDLWMLCGVFADYEESRFNVMSGRNIEQFWVQRAAGTVVKSHRDVRSSDVNGTKRDTRFGRSIPAVYLCLLGRDLGLGCE